MIYVQGDAKMRVSMFDCHKIIANFDGDIERFLNFAAQDLSRRFAAVNVAIGKLPQAAEQPLVLALFDQQRGVVPNQPDGEMMVRHFAARWSNRKLRWIVQ